MAHIFKQANITKIVAVTAVAFMMNAAPVWAQSATSTSTDPSTSSTSSTSKDQSSASSGASGTTGATSASGETAKSPSSGASGTGGAMGATSTTSSTDTAGASGTAAAAGGQVGKADRQLMKELALSNLGEIAAAKLALEKASSDEVKKYAQQMIDDHTKAQDQLQQLAQQKGVTLPTKPDAKHQAMVKKMQGMSGDAFDKQYIANAGVKDHHKADKLVDRGTARAKDPELKALITQMEPTIQQHLKMAGDMRKGGMGGATSGSTGASGSSGASGASGSTDASSGSAAGASGSTSAGSTGTSSDPTKASGSGSK